MLTAPGAGKSAPSAGKQGGREKEDSPGVHCAPLERGLAPCILSLVEVQTFPSATGSRGMKGALNVQATVIMLAFMEQSLLLLCYGAKA